MPRSRLHVLLAALFLAAAAPSAAAQAALPPSASPPRPPPGLCPLEKSPAGRGQFDEIRRAVEGRGGRALVAVWVPCDEFLQASRGERSVFTREITVMQAVEADRRPVTVRRLRAPYVKGLATDWESGGGSFERNMKGARRSFDLAWRVVLRTPQRFGPLGVDNWAFYSGGTLAPPDEATPLAIGSLCLSAETLVRQVPHSITDCTLVGARRRDLEEMVDALSEVARHMASRPER